MNITFQTMKNTSYHSPIPTQQKYMPQAGKTKGDYDTVNIRRSQAAPDSEESFARMLARKTSAQMSSVSQERVQELKREIAGGTYQPDAQRIAGRMLGLS